MSRVGTIIALLACCISVALAQNSADTPAPVPATPGQFTRPRRVRVSMRVMLGMVERRTLPVYPDDAMKKGIQGDVIFMIDIDETGKIALATPIDGDSLLIAASVDALRGFPFRPYLLNGTPIGMESMLAFRFSLEKTTDDVRGHVECLAPESFPSRRKVQIDVNDKGVLVVDPRKLSGPEPQLPPELAGKSGSVYLKIIIGVDGKIQDVKVIGGDEPFIGSVVAAVKQAVYEPQLIDGKPSVATTEANYHFGPRH